MSDYDPEAIARACLAEQLESLTDMDDASIAEAAGFDRLTVPDEDDTESWNAIGEAIGRLAGGIRETFLKTQEDA